MWEIQQFVSRGEIIRKYEAFEGAGSQAAVKQEGRSSIIGLWQWNRLMYDKLI